MIKSKFWAISFLLYVSLLFLIIAGITGIVDPFFHYHAPLDSLQYPLAHPQYQNDGIVKHFDYDALIVGTSMTDNFRTSEMDSIFGTNSIKASTPGGSYAEIKHNLETALETNSNIKLVICAFDSWFISAAQNTAELSSDLPLYLYDDNFFNDVNYLLNKEILFSHSLNTLMYTKQGNLTTSFDQYNNWRDFRFGREETLKNHTRPEKSSQVWTVDEEYLTLAANTIEQEIVSLARQYPNVTFCYYFPPYSALYWDKTNQYNSLENDVATHKAISKAFLQAENIQLYSFHDDFEITTNLDNYRDECHHTSEINSRILNKIHAGEHRLTLDNYEQYWDDFLAFYHNFDFDSLFEA